jgi:hypothetical protein
MSRNSKNAKNLAKARSITLLHKSGEKGPSNTGTSKKKNAWWQRGDYSSFAKGKDKDRKKDA